jgi:hypothetical protein
MRTIVTVVTSIMGALANLTMVLFVIMYIFAVVGMQVRVALLLGRFGWEGSAGRLARALTPSHFVSFRSFCLSCLETNTGPPVSRTGKSRGGILRWGG